MLKNGFFLSFAGYMQFHHPDLPKLSSVRSVFLTKTFVVQFDLKEGI